MIKFISNSIFWTVTMALLTTITAVAVFGHGLGFLYGIERGWWIYPG